MRSNYKKLGPYIREVSVKNKDLEVGKLLGVSITKAFITSIANTVGTDMSKYKIVRTNQFAYGPVTSRNGEKISVALLQENDCIISTSYTVFEIIDHEKLDPEYLMMWFRRPEFDRYARYKSHGSVREIFGWEELCDVQLPIPPIEKQREIVSEYNAIVNCIKLNEEINQKLEETAQAIYKHWFVDFEFPISAEYATSIGKPELEGKPYKSSGGEMVFSEEMDKKIPKEWKISVYTSVIDLKGGGTPKTKVDSYWNGSIPFFTPGDVGNSVYTFYTEKTITDEGLKNSSTKYYEKDTVFITARGTVGAIAMAAQGMAMNQSCYAALGKKSLSQYYVHQLTIHTLNSLKNEAIGGVFGALVTKNFDQAMVLEVDPSITSSFGKFIEPIYKNLHINQSQINQLWSLKGLLLSGIVKTESERFAA